MIVTIEQIENSIKNMDCEITYKYRNSNNEYVDYTNNQHLMTILNSSKVDRLLNYVDKTSGHPTYQSIILDNEYIRIGSESDWISFENILKCTTLKDKIICDTGCFNGYFSFSCIKEGAKQVIGIDHDKAAINICNKICIYNNYHLWKMGVKKDISCELGINFHLLKLGKEDISNVLKTKVDILFALNYLHHLINELGIDIFKITVDSFFKNSNEIIFEVNESEIKDIEIIANNNKFILSHKIESHRKTMFGNRWVLYYKNIC